MRKFGNPRVWLVAMVACVPTLVAAQWAPKPAGAALKEGNPCTIETPKLTVFDGYNDTLVWLELDDSTLQVRTQSVIDPGFSDIGLVVDRRPFIAVDRIEKGRAAVFQSEHVTLVEQFRAGKSVVVHLRFWPTWPTTGLHPAAFSLVGFSKAHDGLKQCKH
jgi:hypothetical protein